MAVALGAYRPTSSKVYQLDVHPTQPWVVTSDEDENVVVWDWEHRQVLYELNAAGIDSRRLVDTQLNRMAEGEVESKKKSKKGAEALRGGSVKDIRFYDEDVRYWRQWISRAAALESPIVKEVAKDKGLPPISSPPEALKGRRYLVICCENKIIFLDLLTMKARDISKVDMDNKSPQCVEFLPHSLDSEDGPFAAVGGSDGVIRILSFANWKFVKKFSGGHKGGINCLTTYMTSKGETILVSGGVDGYICLWDGNSSLFLSSNHLGTPRLCIPKVHDGGVYSMSLFRRVDMPPHIVTCGADKSVSVWDCSTWREVSRIKPVSKMVCNSVATWNHPRAPSINVLITVKDSYLRGISNNGTTAALFDVLTLLPPAIIASGKKLKIYCMSSHPLQPHLIFFGTNVGVIVSLLEPKCLPPAAVLPASLMDGSRKNSSIFVHSRSLLSLSFQENVLSKNNVSNDNIPKQQNTSVNSSPVSMSPRPEPTETHGTQVIHSHTKVASLSNDGYSIVGISKSGLYMSVVWPDSSTFTIFKTNGWKSVHSGNAKCCVWDSCKDRFATLSGSTINYAPPPVPVSKGLLRSKKKEAAAAAAASASAMASISASLAGGALEVKQIDENENMTFVSSTQPKSELFSSLHGGALLGVASKQPKANPQDAILDEKHSVANLNYVFYNWGTCLPVSEPMPQPDWSVWDESIELCALAYPNYVIIAALRPRFHILGSLAIKRSTNAVWHRRQLFITTTSSVECVFVDPGVSEIDIQKMKQMEEEKLKEAEAKAVAEKGELAVLSLDPPPKTSPASSLQHIQLRPPLLQVVRLASFSATPTIQPITSMVKVQSEVEVAMIGLLDGSETKAPEVVVAGGGISVAATRLPPEQRRPPGALLVVGVRDGILWLLDCFMNAHAISLSHPGIRCRCLAAYGDPVSAVKWASRLGIEHHDDLAQFLVSMGYAKESLHLPGLSKRFEFDLAMQVGDLQRAYTCLLQLSSSNMQKNGLPGGDNLDDVNPDIMNVLVLAASTASRMESMVGVARYADEFLAVIDAADAKGQSDISLQALRKLSDAGLLEGALTSDQLRKLSLRLSTHGETSRLQILSRSLSKCGEGPESSLAAALLGDANLLEKVWHDTGMLPEASLHAQTHGRPSLQALLEQWNVLLQKHQMFGYSHNAQNFHPLQKNGLSSAFRMIASAAKQSILKVAPPGNFSASSDFGSLLQTDPSAMALHKELDPMNSHAAGGIQGMKQPLDLSVLEGFGPAPQKGPSVIAVPLNFKVEKSPPSKEGGIKPSNFSMGESPISSQDQITNNSLLVDQKSSHPSLVLDSSFPTASTIAASTMDSPAVTDSTFMIPSENATSAVSTDKSVSNIDLFMMDFPTELKSNGNVKSNPDLMTTSSSVDQQPTLTRPVSAADMDLLFMDFMKQDDHSKIS